MGQQDANYHLDGLVGMDEDISEESLKKEKWPGYN